MPMHLIGWSTGHDSLALSLWLARTSHYIQLAIHCAKLTVSAKYLHGFVVVFLSKRLVALSFQSVGHDDSVIKS